MRMMREYYKTFIFITAFAGAVGVGAFYWAKGKEEKSRLTLSVAEQSSHSTLESKPAEKKNFDAAKNLSFLRAKKKIQELPRCESLEYAGEGPEKSHLNSKQWSKILDSYHSAKKDLVFWLDSRRDIFNAEVYEWMRVQVKGLRIQRPATPEEIDLSWRGIGVFTKDAQGTLIRVGGGFYKLLEANPTRARFELARLLAQAWSPCEFQKRQLVHPWKVSLGCLGIRALDSNGEKCSADSAEAGWAISTTIARQATPPGCEIPALAASEVQSCLASKWDRGWHG